MAGVVSIKITPHLNWLDAVPAGATRELISRLFGLESCEYSGILARQIFLWPRSGDRGHSYRGTASILAGPGSAWRLTDIKFMAFAARR